MPKSDIPQKRLCIFLYSLKYFGVSKNDHNWFWDSWRRLAGSKSMKMIGVRVLPKWHRKVLSPKWSKMILRSFCVILLSIFTINIASQTLQTPNANLSRIFPDLNTSRNNFGWHLLESMWNAAWSPSKCGAYQWRAFLGAEDFIWSCKKVKFPWEILENLWTNLDLGFRGSGVPFLLLI